MRKKYIFFDYDGTLALPHTYTLPDSTKCALTTLKKNGHFLSLATGRLQADAINFLKDLPFNNAIADGGNSITLDGDIAYIEPLDYETTLNCLCALDEAGYKWAVIPENKLVRYTPFPNFDEGIPYYVKTVCKQGITPKSFNAFFKVYVKVKKGAAQDVLTKSEMMKNIPWCSSTLDQIFIEPTQKEAGIRKLMEMLGAPIEDVVVFGDGNNDVSMFSNAWTNIAMGNAIEKLKQRATYITSDIEDDGIYNACKHFGWI